METEQAHVIQCGFPPVVQVRGKGSGRSGLVEQRKEALANLRNGINGQTGELNDVLGKLVKRGNRAPH